MSESDASQPMREVERPAAQILPMRTHTAAQALASPPSSSIVSHSQGHAPPVAANSAAGTAPPASPQVSFDHAELREILNLYGRMVAGGEWRDYAIDFLKDKAVFSVFRRTAEMPLYRIEKNPRLARRQGAYAIVAASGMILKRGHDLARVLRVLDKPVRIVAN